MAHIDYTKIDRLAAMAAWAKVAATNQSAESLYSNNRKDISANLAKLMTDYRDRDMNNIVVTLQADALGYRCAYVEEIAVMMRNYAKVNNHIKKITGDRREFYATGFGLKLGHAQVAELMDRDLSEWQTQIAIFEVHIQFLRESVKTCDQIGYAIKNRIELLRHTFAQQ